MATLSEAQKIEAIKKVFPITTDSELLEALRVELELFTQSSSSIMKVMIDELIRRKVYPESTPVSSLNDIYTMVSGLDSTSTSGRGQ